MGWQNAFHCEIDDFCNTILNYWFKDAKSYTDVTTTDFREWRGKINVLTGGFPCQPFSVAGQRKGADDNRYLWPHMLRAIHEIRPDWVIGENVAGILTMVQPGRRLKWEVNPLYSERVSLYLKDDSNMLLKPFAVILNAKDIPSSRYLYRLVPSVHLTDGIEFGLLPTVTAQDYKRRGPGSRQQGLPEIIHGMLLPTPVSTQIHHAERVRKWKSMNLSSPHAQIAGEKNPNGLTDFLDFYGILPEPIPDNTELENTDGNNLEESILQWLAEGQVMPTPTARDWKGAPSLENLKKRGKIPQKNSLPDFFARTGKSFQLNPLFVAEMMGFPPDWTVSPFLGEDRHPLKDTGTLSSPR